MIAGTTILGFAGTLGGIDISIVAVAVLLLFVISYVFGREEKDTNDFFSVVVVCPRLQPVFPLSPRRQVHLLS
jgi:hypothetical protein